MGSFACCGSGVLFLWIDVNGAAWIGFSRIGSILFLIGVVLLFVAIILFILRSFLLNQALRKHGILVNISDLFRPTEKAREYQHDIWLQGVVWLTFPAFIILALLSHQVVQDSSLTLMVNRLSIQSRTYLDSCIILTICLIFPLGIFLYSLVAKDMKDILSHLNEQ
jgi:hypothetical protein